MWYHRNANNQLPQGCVQQGFINVQLFFVFFFNVFICTIKCFIHILYRQFGCASTQADIVLPVGKGCSTPRSQSDHTWRRHEAAEPGPAAGHRWGGNRPPESSRCCPELLPPRLLGERRHSESSCSDKVLLLSSCRPETRICTFYDTGF